MFEYLDEIDLFKIGLGGIPIQRISDEDGIELVRKSKDFGINFIDTAKGYTKSEEIIGKGIKGIRESFILATKSMSRDYDKMKEDIEDSLKKLQTDYIDLYQLHNISNEKDYYKVFESNGAYTALLDAQKEGKIKKIGITSHSIDIINKALETDYFDTIQFPYNIVENQAELAFKKAYEKNIGVIVMKPLAGGAIEDGKIAMKYILNNKNVSVIIPGMDKLEQLEENTNVYKNGYTLSEEDKDKIASIKSKLNKRFCRRCGYCMPCPEDINIPGQFLMEGYYSRYDLKNWAKTRYFAMDKTASDCKSCGVCEKRCPYDLPIREMLKEVSITMGK